jgi:hypothetical protein
LPESEDGLGVHEGYSARQSSLGASIRQSLIFKSIYFFLVPCIFLYYVCNIFICSFESCFIRINLRLLHAVDYRWEDGRFPCPQVTWQFQTPNRFPAVQQG